MHDPSSYLQRFRKRITIQLKLVGRASRASWQADAHHAHEGATPAEPNEEARVQGTIPDNLLEASFFPMGRISWLDL